MDTTKQGKNELKTSYKRVIVKFGTSLLTGGTDRLDKNMMSMLVDQLAELHNQGHEIIIVSSGAVAAGRHKLAFKGKPKNIPFKQVLAAVGQGLLMNTYDQLFSQYGIAVAQALLTKHDLSDRAGYLNARNTLLALLELRVMGIVNENDVVTADEIKEAKFGQNDTLSAMVANLVDADLLLNLSDVEGLFTADPHLHPEAKLVPLVKKIDAKIESLVSGSASEQGTGGGVTKIEAAKLATSSGVTLIICDGRKPGNIVKAVTGKKVGTLFLPVTTKLESRQRWMLSGLSTKGKLVVDSGAATALKKNNRSLLAAGILEVEGEFEIGDIVNICDIKGARLGCGITHYCASDIAVIKGKQSKDIPAKLGHDYGAEVIHRNNLVIL
jgi:glutamate 5-kinase